MDLKLKGLLEEKQSAILARWFEAIMKTYPADDSGFLINKKDRFANPVGHAFSQGLEGILGALIEEKDLTEGRPFLDDIIKVRAVQDFTPSKALSFIFVLKKIIRDELKEDIRQDQIDEELLKFESKIDDLVLFAFNIYVNCRERLSQLRIDELKRMTFTLLKKANLMYDLPLEEVERDDQKISI